MYCRYNFPLEEIEQFSCTFVSVLIAQACVHACRSNLIICSPTRAYDKHAAEKASSRYFPDSSVKMQECFRSQWLARCSYIFQRA